VLDRALAAWFRHRSAVLLLLAWLVVAWLLEGRPVRPADVVFGLALLAGGVVLRLLAIRRIGRRARVYRARARAGLHHSGPYAWSRNPLYLAAALMVTGLALLAGAGLPGLLVSGAAIALYTPVVIHEERALLGLFGPAYAAYCDAVPRWIGLRRAAPAVGEPLVPWAEVMHGEQALVPGCLAAAAGILSVRLGLIPVAAALEPIAQALGTSPAGVVGIGLAAAALLDGWRVDRRLRRRARARSVAAPAPSTSRA
jgi:protein-S-isoprenylcysteine O-methyltransferase Ste14